MVETVRENVLEGILGALVVFNSIGFWIAIAITPQGWTWVSQLFGMSLLGIIALALISFFYKLSKKKICMPTLIILLIGILMVFGSFITLPVIFGISIFELLTNILYPIIGAVLILQAFDVIPIEEKAEIKF